MKEQVKGYAHKREHIEQAARQRAEEKEQQKQAEQEEQKKAELARQEAQKRADPEVAKAEILKVKQRLQELRQRRAQREAIEAARPIPTPRDIGIFDPTLICDIQEFGLYSHVTGFLQHLERQQSQHQYRKSDVLALLPKCLRGPAFAWFKDQTFTTIQDFGRGLAFIYIYYACFTSSASVSLVRRMLRPILLIKSTSGAYQARERLLQGRLQAMRAKLQLQEQASRAHTRASYFEIDYITYSTYYTKRLESPSPYTENHTQIHGEASSACSTDPPATPTSISEPVSPKGSHLPIATLNITPRQAEIASMLATRGFTPKRAEIAASNCPLAPPLTPCNTYIDI
ncbi:hypothetical protein G7Y79_00053g088170 [Physcia stellaris]|nr:hypothetical protein G7Y79_00053g088170 [Physcia stellaris]